MNNILAGNELLRYNSSFIPDSLDYADESNTIGIVTRVRDGNNTYVVYQKGERGEIDWEKPFSRFNDAIAYAKETYEGMLSYFEEMRNPAEVKSAARRKAGNRPVIERNMGFQNAPAVRSKRRRGRHWKIKSPLSAYQIFPVRAGKTYGYYAKAVSESKKIPRREYR